MKAESVDETERNLGLDEIERIGHCQWMVRFPRAGAQYRLEGEESFVAEGTLADGDVFRFRFVARDGSWEFVALDASGSPWKGAENDLVVRRTGTFTKDEERSTEAVRRAIRECIVAFRNKLAWIWKPV